jgi:hypothetical protein
MSKLMDSIYIAKKRNSKRWTWWRLTYKYIMWNLFAKRKGVRWCLPGPTSTSHPYGCFSMMSQPEKGSNNE